MTDEKAQELIEELKRLREEVARRAVVYPPIIVQPVLPQYPQPAPYYPTYPRYRDTNLPYYEITCTSSVPCVVTSMSGTHVQ